MKGGAGGALQPEESDRPRRDVALQGAAGKIGFASVFEQAVLDQLIFQLAFRELAERRIAAVEPHEGILQRIGIFSVDLLVIQIRRNRIVDVEERDGVAGKAGTDVLAERAVDVDFTRDRNSARNQPAVHIAGFKAELPRKGRPAFVRKRNVLSGTFVVFRPVQKCQFKLRHARQKVGVPVSRAKLRRHVLRNRRYPRVAGVCLVGDQQVQLGVLLDLHPEVVQRLDRRVAREEVLRARPECDDLQGTQPEDRARDGNEIGDHTGYAVRRSDRVRGYHRFQFAQAEIVGAVQHAAVSVPAAVDQIFSGFLGGRRDHGRSAELLHKQRFRSLRSEISKEDDEGVAPGGFHFRNGFRHIVFALYDGLAFVKGGSFFRAALHDRPSPSLGKRQDEAVAADRNDAQFYLRNVLAHFHYPLSI